MSLTYSGIVTAVIPTAGQLDRVNVDIGTPDGIPGALVPEWLQLQPGDVVLVDEYDRGLPYIRLCFTPGRLRQQLPFTVTVQDSAPAGMSQMSTLYTTLGVTKNPNITIVRSATPPPPTGGTITVAASSSASYDPALGWRTDNSHVYQGSAGAGRSSGLFFYPSISAAVTGHTISRVQMTVVRAATGGTTWGQMQLRLAQHNYTTHPAGAPALWNWPFSAGGANPSKGATVTFDLPLTWAGSLISGSQAGVGITSDLTSDYLYLLGPAESGGLSGTLTFTY